MSEKLMFARMLNLDYLNSFDQNQLDLSENDITKNINNLVVSMENNRVHLRWNDCINSAWKKSYVVRAEGSIPTSVYNGDVVTSYTKKNEYALKDFVDDNISENVLYCYRVFSEFDNDSQYYSGFKNIFYVYVASVTLCNDDHNQGTILAANVITDPLHRFVSDSQILSWDNKFDGDYANLSNKPVFSNVALSGNYKDLLNRPSLAAIAQSGDYSDLINVPEIPTKTSDLLNDDLFATESFVTNKIAEAQLKDSEVDLSGFATKDELALKANRSELHSHSNLDVLNNITEEKIEEWDSKSDFSGSYEDLIGIPELSEVAITGSYNDLIDLPEIYNKEEVDRLIEGVNTSCDFSGSYNDLTDKPQFSTVATSGSYNDLTSKPDIYQKSEVYTKTEVDDLIEDVITLIPDKESTGGAVQPSAGIIRYSPEGAVNGDCYVMATKPGVTFSKTGNNATLNVPEGVELISALVKFSGTEIGSTGKCIVKFGDSYNFADNMWFPTFQVVSDVYPNRSFKPTQICTLGDHPNELEFTNMNANIGVAIKMTF